MKKLLFALLLIFVGQNVHSQVFFSEDFEAGPDASGLPLGGGWQEQGFSMDGIYMIGDQLDAASGGSWSVDPHSLFIMTNDDACGDDPVNCDKSADRLILPAQDFSSFTGTTTLTADYLIDDEYGGVASVEVSIDGGISWNVIAFLMPSAQFWLEDQVFDLSAFNGDANVLVSVLYSDEFGWSLGLALDNVVLTHTLLNDNADFTVDVTSNCLGSAFNFTDASTGVITDWEWDFGLDATPATFSGQTPPAVTYSSSGLKTITLTINSGADFETKTDFIQVMDIPTVDNDPIVEHQDVCAGQMTTAIDLFGTDGGSGLLDFEWTYVTNPAGFDIGLVSPGTGDIPAFVAVNNTGAPITATFTITPTNNGCNGTPIDITITVNPNDDPTFAYSNTTFCEGSANELLGFAAMPGGTFSSTTPGFVDPATGELNLSAFTAGTYDVSYMTNGICPASSTLNIDILPFPTVNNPGDQSLCGATATTDVLFTGSAGAQFDWTNDNTSIGLAASGTGDILAFMTTNTSGLQQVATVTVTPSAGACTGIVEVFTFTVDPTEDPTFAYSAGTYCQSETNPTTTTLAAGTFSSSPAGLVFADPNGTIDLAASTPGAYSVTFTTGGACPASSSVNVTIAQDPFVDSPASQSLCDNGMSTDILFTGSVGAQYDWTNDNTSIGLGASGTGDILAFLASNTSGVQQIATISVTPSAGACIGNPELFTLTVDPIEDATFSYTQSTYCLTDADPTPTTVKAGGTFSAVPAGLVIDVNSGTIDIAASASGTYDVSYTTGGPCPATLTSQVSVGVGASTVDPIADVIACDNVATTDILITGSAGATFTWTNDNTASGLAASGTGDILSFTPTNATTSAIVSNVTVTPDDGTCPGTPLTFTITVSPLEDASFSLSSTSSCSNDLLNAPTTTITGDAGGTFSAGAGLVIDANTGAIDVTASTPGIYTITYTTAGSCPASTNIGYELIETPVINTLADIEECSGVVVPAIDISALGNFLIDWTNDNTSTGISTVSGTGDIATFLANNSTPGGPSDTAHIVLNSTNNGCSATPVTFDVIIKSLPTVSAGGDRTICEGTSITMTGVGSAATFTWDNAITDGVAFTPVAGSYIYTVTGTTNGCIAQDQADVIVNPAPIVNAGVDRVVCVGSEVTLTASGATTLNWNNGVTDNIPFIPAVAGDYVVLGVSPNGCSARDTLVITLEDLPIPSFTSNINMGCVPTTVIFNSSATTNSCIYTFSDGTIENGCTNVTHTFTSAGVYDVTLNQVSINGCIGSTTIPGMIVINPDPVSAFIVDRPIVNMIDPVTSFTNNSQGALTYEWNFGDNSPVSMDDEPVYAFPGDAPGDFTVSLIAISEFGCKDTSFALVTVEESTIFYIPNSFTPNGDELNNAFNPLMFAGFDPQDYNIKIYDRLGELIFESNDPSYGWDGDYGPGRGLAPTGTYTYKLQFNTPSKDEKKVIVGHVNLLR